MLRRAGAVAVTVSLLSAVPALAAPERLLPDLAQDPPSRVSAREHVGHAYLQFASAVENRGGGPYEIRGVREPDAEVMVARQVVHRDDGSTEELADPAGTLHYEVADTHEHWHFEPFDRYELRALDGSLVASGEKTGYCLGDRYVYSGAPLVEPAAYNGDVNSWCALGEPDRLAPLVMGVSIGWGDLYDPWREGQRIDITGVPAGRYDLVHRIDNAGRLDANPVNDVSAARVEIAWPDGAPAVRVLRVCEASPICDYSDPPAAPDDRVPPLAPGPTGQPVAANGPPAFGARPSAPVLSLWRPAGLRLRNVFTWVRCDIACRVSIRGSVSGGGRFPVHGATRGLRAGRRARIALVLSRRARRSICGAIARGRPATVRIVATAQGSGGTGALVRRDFRVKRC